jgi:hypothetical protein
MEFLSSLGVDGCWACQFEKETIKFLYLSTINHFFNYLGHPRNKCLNYLQSLSLDSQFFSNFCYLLFQGRIFNLKLSLVVNALHSHDLEIFLQVMKLLLQIMFIDFYILFLVYLVL